MFSFFLFLLGSFFRCNVPTWIKAMRKRSTVNYIGRLRSDRELHNWSYRSAHRARVLINFSRIKLPLVISLNVPTFKINVRCANAFNQTMSAIEWCISFCKNESNKTNWTPWFCLVVQIVNHGFQLRNGLRNQIYMCIRRKGESMSDSS